MKKLVMGVMIVSMGAFLSVACSMDKKQDADSGAAVQQDAAAAAPAQNQQAAEAVEVEEVQGEVVEE